MADLWYFTRDGKAMDPVSEAKLKDLAASGELLPSDLVWTEGMSKWVRAGSNSELFGDRESRRRESADEDPDAISKRRRSRFDDEYDDRRRDADRPRRKRGLSKGAKVGITLGIVAGVLVLGGGILAIVLLSGGGSPVGDFVAPFTTNNRLTMNDDVDQVRRMGRFAPRCKIYNVKMTGGTTYSIILRSRQFDAYLRLEDAKGGRLAENDDGGPGFGLDSHILFRAPATANYRVIATSLAPATGEFTLSVQPADQK